MSYLSLLGGLFILAIAGDLVVRGGVGLAARVGVPPIIIGLSIVAFGTSAPELVISVQAALAGAPGIALGNVVGSNIANILLVLGLPALIASTALNQPLVRRNTLFMIGATVLFIAMCLSGRLDAWHGAILLALIVGFLAMSLRRARRYWRARTATAGDGAAADDPADGPRLPAILLLLMGGIVGLPFGAYLAIEGARAIALDWRISEAAIGLTVVALGTSLPELAANIMAAIRRENAIAVGNIIGSNLFNLLGVMGITALIVPVPVPAAMLSFDLWVMLACAILILPYVLFRLRIGQVSGLVFVTAYLAYAVVVIAVFGRMAG